MSDWKQLFKDLVVVAVATIFFGLGFFLLQNDRALAETAASNSNWNFVPESDTLNTDGPDFVLATPAPAAPDK